MRFWDSSALVPLIFDEPTTPVMRTLVAQDADLLIWMMTSVELLSMVGRLGRTTSEISDLLSSVRGDALQLVSRAARVTDADAVRRRAERLVGVHPLSAADAMQLAAALVACEDRPETLPFVTLDRQLANSARLEGFFVVAS